MRYSVIICYINYFHNHHFLISKDVLSAFVDEGDVFVQKTNDCDSWFTS